MGFSTPPSHPGDVLSPAGLVGRDGELAAIRSLVTREDHLGPALVLEGEPGVGKTSLWEQGLMWGREHGLRVLVARASEAETPRSCRTTTSRSMSSRPPSA